MRCILVGNYGCGNLGDEALRDYFLQSFPSVTWTVLSADPQKGELPRLPAGIRSFIATGWWKTIQAIRQTDAVVFGGGSLFTDVESVFACFLWFTHAAAARFFGKPVFLAFQGMGPYRTKAGEWLARKTAGFATYISVRDDESFRRISAWNMNKKIIQTFDPVFSLISEKNSGTNTKKLLTIIPRHNSSESLQKVVSETLKSRAGFDAIHILLMQPDSESELAAAHLLQQTIPTSSIIPVRTLHDLLQEVSASSFVVTQRFHGALAALALNVSQMIVPQGAGDKLSSLISYADGTKPVHQLSTLVETGRVSLLTALESIVLR